MGLLRSVAKKLVVAAALVVGKRVVTGMAAKLRRRPVKTPSPQK
jgi:hypothetical protein